MSYTPITSLPGYPYFYSIPINNYIRNGPDKKSKRINRLQDHNTLPTPHTPAPARSPYILGSLGIQRKVHPDHHLPYAKEQIKRPQTTPPEMTQTRKSRFPPLSTKRSWTAHKPHVSSPLSLSRSDSSTKDLFTIEEKEQLERDNTKNYYRDGGGRGHDSDYEMGDEERVQVKLIESIFLMLHNLQPTYLPLSERTVSQVTPRPSARKRNLSLQPSVRSSPISDGSTSEAMVK